MWPAVRFGLNFIALALMFIALGLGGLLAFTAILSWV
ncbi:hypothetical protein J2764_004184 [Agrobacterium tumefaciens]|nr:hypothetical protein [Agrobacterium tumefaciens]